MQWLKPRTIVFAALTVLCLTLNTAPGIMQNLFLFFVPPQWSYDSSRIAVVEGTNILIYDVASGALLDRLEGHTDTILDVAWSPVDMRIASAGVDQTVKAWDGETGALLQNLIGHFEPVTQVFWSPDGTRLISSGIESNPSLFMWDSQSGSLDLSTDAGSIVDAAFSPNGQVLAISYSSGLSLFDGETLQRIIHQPPTLCCVNQMRTLFWSPDSSQIVTGSVSGLITVWDAATLTQINQFPANGNSAADSLDIPESELRFSWVRDVAFGANGTIQAVSGDGTLRLWDTNSRLLQEAQIGTLETAAWSRYGARLAVQGGDAAALARSTDTAAFDGMLQVVTPFATPERLQAIADMCGAPLTVDRRLDASIAANDMPGFIAQVEALPEGTIPPACAADLLAVAEAIQGE